VVSGRDRCFRGKKGERKGNRLSCKVEMEFSSGCVEDAALFIPISKMLVNEINEKLRNFKNWCLSQRNRVVAIQNEDKSRSQATKST
jgi:hypothetical protein